MQTSSNGPQDYSLEEFKIKARDESVLLGEGKFSKVFKAVHSSGRTFAIKIVS